MIYLLAYLTFFSKYDDLANDKMSSTKHNCRLSHKMVAEEESGFGSCLSLGKPYFSKSSYKRVEQQRSWKFAIKQWILKQGFKYLSCLENVNQPTYWQHKDRT